MTKHIYSSAAQNYAGTLRLLCFCVALSGLLSSCSQESNGIVSKAYHNTTAHYNAYFLADNRLREVERKIFNDRKDDYNQILDIVFPIDSVKAAGLATENEYIVQKSSLAIQRHKNSKWVDDSYLILGKARYYQFDFQKALETFKYVNSNSTDDRLRQQALIGIFRTYVQTKEYANARAVINYIKREQLDKKNLMEFYLVRAQMHKDQEEYIQAAAMLTLALPMMRKGEPKARTHYILAQLHQHLEKSPEAYQNFRATLKNNPTYELSFYARLNMLRNYQARKGGDSRKMQAQFRRMLRDEKNIDLKDKIYYYMALYEANHNQYDKAIQYLKQSAGTESADPIQKGYTYLKLGEIHFENLQKYELAKSYYDSTVQVLPQSAPNYEAVAKRQKVLGNFVEQIVTIQVEDSLQRLAQMDSVSLHQYLDEIVAREEREAEAARKAADRLARNTGFNEAENTFANAENLDPDNPVAPAAPGQNRSNAGGNQWYFYNNTAVSQGRTAFARKWGTRKLEDNWRRSTKEDVPDVNQAPQENQPKVIAKADSAEAPPKSEALAKKERTLQAIPRTPEAIDESNKRVEDAFYNLGKIYNLELEEPEKAVESFSELLTRFPQSEHCPEVYYFMYLIHKNLALVPEQEEYKNKLLTQYPTSTFAKLALNPNHVRDENLHELNVREMYHQAFEMYKAGNYAEASSLVNSTLQQYPTNSLSERFELLNILITGRTQKGEAFKKALNDFIQQHPQSELVPYVQNILQNGENFARGK